MNDHFAQYNSRRDGVIFKTGVRPNPGQRQNLWLPTWSSHRLDISLIR